MITLTKLGKYFRGRQVVKDLSFTAQDGAITGLHGVNGAGKTTTLRMICGVLKPESGSISIDGSPGDVHSQQRVGALLDHMGLYSRLTVRENLAYFGRLRGIPTADLGERVDRVISVLGLNAIADRPTAGFSQGERMKTGHYESHMVRRRNVRGGNRFRSKLGLSSLNGANASAAMARFQFSQD
jgi:sodium transport system ATP-binding protein